MPRHLHRRVAQNRLCRWDWTGWRTSNEVVGRFVMLSLAIIRSGLYLPVSPAYHLDLHLVPLRRIYGSLPLM
jgi:hypothetical protein